MSLSEILFALGDLPDDPRVNISGETWRAVVGHEYNEPAASNAHSEVSPYGYDVVTLRREPRNRHDKNAVAVVFRGHRIGYLAAPVAAMMQQTIRELSKADGDAVAHLRATPDSRVAQVWVPKALA